jgi:cytochrome c oxidase subunit 3/cytochrome o ubiquinol oxidase subunit 3
MAAGDNATLAAPPFPLSRGQVGMLCFLGNDAFFFGSLIVTYLYYVDRSRPYAASMLHLPLVIVNTVLLLSSSVTVHMAVQAAERRQRGLFRALWAATILLGLGFLAGTAVEWSDLIGRQGLTLASNLFGTTYFTLVGFHAAHVTIGVVLLGIFLGSDLFYLEPGAGRLEIVSWYWHFVDAVWVAVFCVVYLIGR